MMDMGYRSWLKGYEGKSPRLKGPSQKALWTPRGETREVWSDYAEKKEAELKKALESGEIDKVNISKRDYDSTGQGLYSLSSYKELMGSSYPSKKSIEGAIVPCGRVEKGCHGYRAEKAVVDALFRKDYSCSICGKPASREFMAFGTAYPVCSHCLSTINRHFGDIKSEGDVDLEEYLNRLAGEYNASLVEPPEI